MSERTRVLLIDDSRDILDLYRRLLDRQPDMQCVHAAETAAALEHAVRESGAQVAVVDLVCSGSDSIAEIGAASRACPDCRFLVFSGHDDPGTREEATRAGAFGLVSKHGSPIELLDEIRRAAAHR